MTETQTANMIKHAATSAERRKHKIMDAIQQANYNAHPALKEFGLHVNDKFEQVDARVLVPPQLLYDRLVGPRAGVWRASRFKEAKQLRTWGLLSLDFRTNEGGLQQLAQEVSLM